MKFFYVYILKSINKDFIYAGFTTNLRIRFDDHNSGKELSTKHYAPFELIHYEAYRNEKDAKRREKYFKTNKGKTTLKTMLKEYFVSVNKERCKAITDIVQDSSIRLFHPKGGNLTPAAPPKLSARKSR